MNDDVEQQVLEIVRRDLMLGADRPVSMDVPIGDLGFDSLGVVQLATTIDVTFNVELSDQIITSIEPLTLREIAHLIVSAPQSDSPPSSTWLDPKAMPPMVHPIEVLESRLAKRGKLGAMAWPVVRVVWPLPAAIFSPWAEFVFMERSLVDPPLRTIDSPQGVDLRRYRLDDKPTLAGLWPSYLAGSAGRAVGRWLAGGGWAVVAVEKERVVGISVCSERGANGIVLRPNQGATWGVYLREAPDVRGRGIGLALLSYSLADTRSRGFKKNYTFVSSENAPMLAATTQFLGYRQIGSAKRIRILRLNHYRWKVNDRAGRGSHVYL